MKTIHKFTIVPTTTPQTTQIRKNAKLIKVAAQDGAIALWYEVDTHEGWQTINLIAYETGKEFDPDFVNRQSYLDTVFFHAGAYVLHIYQII